MNFISTISCSSMLALGLFSASVSAADFTAIPSCTGWKLVCPSHAPDWVINFEPDSAYIQITDTDANLLPAQSVGSTVTASTPNSTTFTLANGVEGRITLLPHPTCNDGHFFGSAPFSIEILTGLSGVSPATGATACCVLQPY